MTRNGKRLCGRLLAVAAALLFGCSVEHQAPPNTLTGKVVIKGSNTFGEELGPGLIAGYKQRQPGVVIELETKGSVSGFPALVAGECDIASSSRPPTSNELEQARSQGIVFNEYTVGSYGVAVIVNRNNAVTNLTKAEVRDIFSGAITNWSRVGGANAPIHLYIRDPISGTHLGFRELAMENKPYAPSAQAFTNYAALVEAVAKDVNGIGYSSMGLAGRDGARAVVIQGRPPAAPNVMTVNEGWYPYARILRLYTNKANESAVAKDFILFVQSKPGQKIVEQMGFVRRLEPTLRSYDVD